MRYSTVASKAALALIAGLLALGLGEGLYRGVLFVRSRLLYFHENAFDMYLLGGSVAGGIPYSHDMAFGPIASKALGDEVAGRRIVPLLLAGVHNTTYDDGMLLRKILRYRNRRNPSAILIYAGGNESFFQKDPGMACTLLRRVKSFLKSSLLASELLFRLEDALGWGGAWDYPGYESQLRLGIEAALGSGIKPILLTRPINLSGREPELSPDSLSLGGPGGIPAVSLGLSLEKDRRWQMAIAYYEYMARRYPLMARLFYHRLCRCRESLGQRTAALRCYQEQAQPEVGSQIAKSNLMVKRLAAEYGIPVLDSGALLEKSSPSGVPGNEFFADRGHPNTAGHIVLGMAVAEKLSQLFNVPVRRATITTEDVLRWARLTPEQQACGLVTTGMAAISGFAGYPYPVQRLKLAETSFRKAMVLEPALYAGWIGLGLVEEAKTNGGMLQDYNDAWFRTIYLSNVPCIKAHIPGGDFRRLDARWRRAGVSQAVIAQTLRLSGHGPDARRGVAAPPASPAPLPAGMEPVLASISPQECRKGLNILASLTQQYPGRLELWLEAADAALGAGELGSAARFLSKARALKPSAQQQRRIDGLVNIVDSRGTSR